MKHKLTNSTLTLSQRLHDNYSPENLRRTELMRVAGGSQTNKQTNNNENTRHHHRHRHQLHYNINKLEKRRAVFREAAAATTQNAIRCRVVYT